MAVYSLDAYVKYVLPAEWYSCWGALAQGINSLKAGAVAIRSYGIYYVSVLPKITTTDTGGQAAFTVIAKNRMGRTKITFKAGNLKETIFVKIKK